MCEEKKRVQAASAGEADPSAVAKQCTLPLPLPSLSYRWVPTCALRGPPTSAAAEQTALARFYSSTRRARSPSRCSSCRQGWRGCCGGSGVHTLPSFRAAPRAGGAAAGSGCGEQCFARRPAFGLQAGSSNNTGPHVPCINHTHAPAAAAFLLDALTLSSRPPCPQAAAAASCEAATAATGAVGCVGSVDSGAADMVGSGDLGGSLMSASAMSEVPPERGASMALDGATETEGAEMEAEVGS